MPDRIRPSSGEPRPLPGSTVVPPAKPLIDPASPAAASKVPQDRLERAAETQPAEYAQFLAAAAQTTAGVEPTAATQPPEASSPADFAGATAPGQPALGTPEFEAKLDAASNSTVRLDNHIEPLFDGVNSFAARSKLIESANESIHLQTFIFDDDETGWALARQLADKAEDGVSVRVIYDALGSMRADEKMFDFMRAAGVEVRKYGDPVMQFWDLNDRWHEKHLIVDGRAAIDGGMNIADEYALGGTDKQVPGKGKAKEPWRDVDVLITGPVVADIQQAFVKNWETLGGKLDPDERQNLFPPLAAVADGPAVRFVQHRPDEEGDANTAAVYLQAIRSAEQSITIENAYFIPPKELRDALLDAARRGVHVRVMTNSAGSTDMGFVYDAVRYYYDDLMAAGVEFYEKQGGMVHSKTMAVDGSYSIIGSVNLNGRSAWRDSEALVAISDKTTAEQLERRFDEGLTEARPVSKQELKTESLLTNLKQWAVSLLSWTF